MKKFFLSSVALLSSLFIFAGNIIVSNNNNSGSGSLRSAISLAGNGDTIRFAQGLIINGNSTILLTSEIEFSKDLVIKGLYNSGDTLFISGGGTNRIFSITDTVSSIILDSVVLINGSGVSGGAIYFENIEHLKILNSILKNNNATSNRGGAISSYPYISTEVTIENSIFTNNTASLNGGAIYLYALDEYPIVLTISNSHFSNNTSGESGGAIHIESDSVITTILNSTISFNEAASGGGGLYSNGETLSKVEVTNSTINNNNAGAKGGGIASISGGSSFAFSYVTVLNTTIVGNISSLSNPYGSQGGGIFSSSRVSVVSLTNSTITGNDATLGGGVLSYSTANYFPTIEMKSSIIALNGANNIKGYSLTSSLGHNVFSDATITNSLSSDQLNIGASALNLQALAFNGGETQTVLPIYPSVAINKGSPLDNSDAQNASILGVRDVGAAESEYTCEVTGIDTIIACISYTWINGITYNNSNSSAVDTLVSSSGCDSIVTLNLTIKTVDLLIGAYGPGFFAGASNANFRWLNCSDNSVVVGETNQTFIPTYNGSYAVEVTQSGCTDTSNCLSINTISIEEELAQRILIYPNPATNNLTIKTTIKNGSVSIYSSIGKLVFTSKKMNQSLTIDVHHLPPGIYTLIIKNKNGLTQNKVIIQ